MSVARILNRGLSFTDLVRGVTSVPEGFDRTVTAVSSDSRDCSPGTLFMACVGASRDGRQFIDNAIAQGAVAVLAEKDDLLSEPQLRKGVPVIPVAGLSARVGQIAARFNGYPARHLWLYGITGTNGKTSTCQFIASYYEEAGVNCGISGTLGSGLFGKAQLSRAGVPGTTPDAIRLQELFTEVVEQGAGVMAMEVSSHGLDQHRVEVDDFNVAVFTNLSRDHLDYHETMEAYGAAKRKLFSGSQLKAAVLNLDDPFSASIMETVAPQVLLCTYSLSRPEAAVYARSISHHSKGMSIQLVTPWGEATLNTPLLGSFNASNLLAALSAILVSVSREPGFDFQAFIKRAEKIGPVSGRMEVVDSRKPLVVVDYAHSPEALRTALQALREHVTGRICCVFGCGGNRDTGKRPLMAAIAESCADRIVVTDDNPRDEESSAIIDDIMQGFTSKENVTVIPDRASAIARAIEDAGDNDVVLLAGKGHETYQDVRGNRLPFSDVSQARLSLQRRAGGQQ